MWVIIIVAILGVLAILFVGAQIAPETAKLSRFCTHHNANLDYTAGLGLEVTDDGRLTVTCTGGGQKATYVLRVDQDAQNTGPDGDTGG